MPRVLLRQEDSWDPMMDSEACSCGASQNVRVGFLGDYVETP